MRLRLMGQLAWHDYRREGRLSACAILALVAVLAPCWCCSVSSSA
ncbi:hypothetical protein A471_22958 [Ectopseudomonas mendocina DLHK]|nr:hypothetical protein A471_22958 [Pseudomonas mendocina DLHK]